MDISAIVLMGIKVSRSNVIIYKQVRDEWAASVYYEGLPLFSTPGCDTIDEVEELVPILIEQATGKQFKLSEWVVYGKRLSDKAQRQFTGVSHCNHA